MKKLAACVALTVLAACSADDSERTELPRMATSREMEVIHVLVTRYRTNEEAAGRYFKRKARALPVWSRLLPLHIVRTNGLAQKHPSFEGFVVPWKAVVSHIEAGHQAFNIRDSIQWLQQVRETDILLDSVAFRPDSLLTPQLYKQPQVRRKVHGYWFYRFSQPLFSPDGNAAYVQADIAGSRESYVLLKSQGQWAVTQATLLWVE